MVVVAALLACSAPDPSGGTWTLEFVPGDGLLVQDLGCQPTFQLAVSSVDWVRPCGRGDLPDEMVERTAWPDARVYEVGGGGPGTGGTWVVRDGDHHGLLEMWFYDHLVEEPEDFDAIGVARMWIALEGGGS